MNYLAIDMGLLPNFMLTGNEMLILVAISILYAIGSILMQRKISNAKKLRATQAKIQKVTDEMKVMMKNKASDAEIAAKQKEIMPLINETMMSSFKPMFVILPIFFLMYYLLIPHIPFAIGNVKNVQYFFFLVTLVVGLILGIVFMIRDRKVMKMEMEAMELAEQPQGQSNK